MISKNLWLLGVITLNFPLLGKELSLSDFIKTATDNQSMTTLDSLTAQLDQSNFNLDYFDKIELRYKSEDMHRYRTDGDNFRTGNQQFSMKLSFKNWGEQDHIDSIASLNDEHLELLKKRMISQAIKLRYKLLLEHIYLTKSMVLEKQLSLIHKDTIKVLKNKVNDLDFQWTDLLTAEENETQQQLKLIKLEQQRSRNDDQINSLCNNCTITYNDNILIKIDQINNFLNSDTLFHSKSSSIIREAKVRHHIDQELIDLEEERSKKWLNFVRFNYQKDLQQKEDNTYHFEIGIELPIRPEDTVDLMRKKLKVANQKIENDQIQKMIDQELRQIPKEIAGFFQVCQSISSQEVKKFRSQLFDNQDQATGSNPLALLALKKRVLSSDLRFLKCYQEIVSRYIKYLYLTDRLTSDPLKNFLLQDMRPI